MKPNPVPPTLVLVKNNNNLEDPAAVYQPYARALKNLMQIAPGALFSY